MSRRINLSEPETILTQIIREKSPLLSDWTVQIKKNVPGGLEHYTRRPHILYESKTITLPESWDFYKITANLQELIDEAESGIIHEATLHNRYLNSLEEKLIGTLNAMRRERPEKLAEILESYIR